jgi:hypothetical protein
MRGDDSQENSYQGVKGLAPGTYASLMPWSFM